MSRAKYTAAWRAKNPFKNKCNQKAADCRKKNLKFNLDEQYLKNIFPKVCPILKTPMDINSKPYQPTSPEIDRIYPDRGYIKGNVMWISKRANVLKGSATTYEITMLHKWLVECQQIVKIRDNEITTIITHLGDPNRES